MLDMVSAEEYVLVRFIEITFISAFIAFSQPNRLKEGFQSRWLFLLQNILLSTLASLEKHGKVNGGNSVNFNFNGQ